MIHGTRSRYVGGCRCAACTDANRRYLALLIRTSCQRARLAPRDGTPWTEQDDEQLVNGSGTVLDRAVALGRSYHAARRRLVRLRAQGA